MSRKCPKCGKTWKGIGRMRCNAVPKCETRTVEVIDWTEGDEQEAMLDLELGEMEDPFEDYDEVEPFAEDITEPEPEEDLREDLVGQADQIHDILELGVPLTYEDLGALLNPPVSADRASRLVSQMIRDGVELVREGSPRKVSIAANPDDTKAKDA